MIVVDAMILAYTLVEVPERTEEVDRALRKKDATWASPPLWRSELRNVLLKYVRATSEDIPGSDLTLSDALEKMQLAERLVEGRTVEVKTEDVLRVAERSGLSGYDAEYVALAEDLGVRLLTTDGPVLRACPDVAVHPKDLAEEASG